MATGRYRPETDVMRLCSICPSFHLYQVPGV
jgi:hypothetical protein